MSALEQATAHADHSHAAFVADEGGMLERAYCDASQAWLEVEYGQPVTLEVADRWRTPVRGNKRDYRACEYTDEQGRPRLYLIIHDHKTGENLVWDDYAVFDELYRDWLERRRALSAKERAAWETRRAEREQIALQAARKRAERAEQAHLEVVNEEARRDENIAAEREVWGDLPEYGRSAYLRRKGLPHVAPFRYDGQMLVLPLWSATGKFAGAQRLRGDGRKRFTSGARKKGAFTVLGGAPELEGRLDLHDLPRFLAEGVATAVRPHQVHNEPVIVAYDANNVTEVIRTVCEALDEAGMQAEKRAWLRCLVILADNDIWRAAQLRNGVALGNVGLEAAHEAALRFKCRVVCPDFTGLDSRGRPTDFDDLGLLAGLGAVRQQLEHPTNADPALAYAADRRQRDRRLKGASFGRYLEKIELEGGVTQVRAPHGVGKTEALKPHVDAELAAGGRVLYVTPSAKLTEDAARRLGLESYADALHRGHLHLVPGTAICVNSLPRLLDQHGNLDAADLLILDESEQLVRALKGAHMAKREWVLEALVLLIQRARRVVCLDADLGQLTRTLLGLARPRERYHYIEHYHPVGEGRTMRLHTARDDLYAALRSCTVPALVMTNSKREAEALGADLETQGKRVRVLTGERNADDVAFMADLDENAKVDRLEALVCSPTVRTGVSLTSGYFKRVFGVFWAAVGVPEDALQALWRVRTPADYDIWLDPRTTHEHIDLIARYGATREHEVAALGRRAGEDSPVYRTIKLAVERAGQRSRSAYRLNFLRLAALQGFAFETLEHDPRHEGIAASARVLADQQHNRNIATQRARVLSWGENASTKADELVARRFLSRDDQAALECYRVVNFYQLTAEDDFLSVLELDHRGRYRRQLTRLELTLAPVDAVQSAVDELLKERTLADDIPALASSREFHRRVLEAVGFDVAAQRVLGGDAAQLDLPRYNPETLEPLRAWVETNRTWLAGLVALPTADRLKANLIRYLSSWLKALGLKQRRTGDSVLGFYSLELEVLKTACSTLQKRQTLLPLKVYIQETVCTPPLTSDDPVLVIADLLNAGKLSAFGPQKLQVVRKKLDENEVEWLGRLANSRDLGRALGATM